jgi:hypothetical protein
MRPAKTRLLAPPRAGSVAGSYFVNDAAKATIEDDTSEALRHPVLGVNAHDQVRVLTPYREIGEALSSARAQIRVFIGVWCSGWLQSESAPSSG